MGKVYERIVRCYLSLYVDDVYKNIFSFHAFFHSCVKCYAVNLLNNKLLIYTYIYNYFVYVFARHSNAEGMKENGKRKRERMKEVQMKQRARERETVQMPAKARDVPGVS